MRLAPKLAMTVALLSMAILPSNFSVASAADPEAPAAADNSKVGITTTATLKTADESKKQSDIVTVNRRVAAFEYRLTNALAEGSLTSEDVDAYIISIDLVKEEEAQCLAAIGKLTPFQEQKLNLALDRLERQFATHLHDRKVAIPDIAQRLNEIERSMVVTAEDGRLTPGDAATIASDLLAWHEKEVSLLRDGQLSYSDALLLSMQLDHIVNKLGHSLQPRPIILPDFKSLVAAAEKSLTDNESKISPEAAKALKKRLEDDKAGVAKLPSLGDSWRRLRQTFVIAADLETVKERSELLGAGKVAVVESKEREKQLDQLISDTLVHGTITPNEAHELKAELAAIVAESTDTALATTSPDKPPHVAVELERLSNRVERTKHTPRLPWTGLAGFQATLDQNIDEALKAGRITTDQAKELAAKSDELALKAKEMTASEGNLDTAEALELAIQLQRVGVDLHHSLKDRDVSVPDIAALQAQLDKLIADSIESGKLRVSDRMAHRVSHITSLREQYEKTPQGLDDRAKLAVGSEIQRLSGDLLQEIHHDEIHAPSSLETRLNNMSKELSTSVSRGVLAVDRAAQYKSAIDTVYGDLWTDRKKPGGLSPTDSFTIADDVEVLEDQLHDELRENASMPRQLVPRYHDLVMDIGRALAAGRITTEEADILLADLSSQTWSHAEATSSQGGLSHGEGLRLSYEIERISAKLASLLRDEQIPIGNIASRALRLDTSLANGLASGKLNVRQAQDLESSLEHVLATSAAYNNSGNGMSYPEAVTVCIELDRLGATIDSEIAKNRGDLDVSTKQIALHKRIRDAVTNGKLSNKDAEAFHYDLERIAESEASFRVSDEGLNFAEALTLALDIERVSARLESVSKGPSLSLKGKR